MRKFGWLVLLISVLTGGALVGGCGGAKEPEKAATGAGTKTATPQVDSKPTTGATSTTGTAPTAPGLTAPGPTTTAAPTGPTPVATKINSELQQRILAFGAKQKAAEGDPGVTKNNLKQIGIAFHHYHDTKQHFPANNGNGDKNAPQTGLSWRVYLLPSLDQAALFQEFKFDEPWDSTHNKPLIAKMPKVFGTSPEGKTRVHVLTGPGTPFQKDVGKRMADITDGTSNTLLCVVGGVDTADVWTKPGGLPFDPEEPLKCLGKIGDKFLVAMMDGAVRFIAKDVKPVQFTYLAQNADNTVVGDIPDSPSRPSIAAAKVAAPVTPLQPASNQLDLSYIPADAFAAIVVHPRRIIAHPVVAPLIASFRKVAPPNSKEGGSMDWINEEMIPYPMRHEMKQLFSMVDAAGTTPQNVDEIVVLVDQHLPSVTGNDQPGFGIIVRNSAPLAVDNILASLSSSSTIEIREHEGVALIVNPVNGAAIGMINESMLIAGLEPFVKKMISARESTTPASGLTKRLHSIGNRLVVLAVDAVPVEGTVQELLKQVPPMIGAFASFISGAKELGLSLDFDAPELLHVTLQFKQPQLADGVYGIVQSLYSGFKEQQAPMLREAMTSDPGGKGFLPYFDQLIAETKLENAGGTISLTVPKLKNLEQLVDAFKPAFEQVAKSTEQLQHKNQLKQIGLALHNYHDVFGAFPALNGPGAKDGPHPGLSWRVYLLPFLDEAKLFSEFKLDEPWDSTHNKPLITKMPKIFGVSKEGKTSIHVFTGPDAPFQEGVGLRMRDVTDGTSNTIAAIETGDDLAEIWTKPIGLVSDPKDPLKCLGNIKEFWVLLLDGSVRRLKDVSPKTFSALIGYRDGQIVNF
ncbi:MAG: hypothetical protein JWM11_2644 [Planctomycetaceae bacterium]|nr:hypothetical protein [Planctomycetaceae bacterium]